MPAISQVDVILRI